MQRRVQEESLISQTFTNGISSRMSNFVLPTLRPLGPWALLLSIELSRTAVTSPRLRAVKPGCMRHHPSSNRVADGVPGAMLSTVSDACTARRVVSVDVSRPRDYHYRLAPGVGTARMWKPHVARELNIISRARVQFLLLCKSALKECATFRLRRLERPPVHGDAWHVSRPAAWTSLSARDSSRSSCIIPVSWFVIRMIR
ncbi:hypothetical protein K491DRAFT_234063 [Lophiostoma macrostomum CBS 122681]|uniref:Uncharacterized protein n=1 Tax=Lophiostoma macrostomum CBS 122681 TaxID=1314788 RepID=A0A6A6THB7_9PLEO|nr:hypothetical protein K491DRAFT_234063 [Lophiostoma macrostomum CBS 122681]